MGDKIMYLKEKNKSSDKDGAGADMEVFEIMVHKLRKEFREGYAQKHEHDSLASDLNDLTEKINLLETEHDRIEESIKDKINAKTRAIFINSPSNPTGNLLSENRIKKIAELVSAPESPHIALLSMDQTNEARPCGLLLQ